MSIATRLVMILAVALASTALGQAAKVLVKLPDTNLSDDERTTMLNRIKSQFAFLGNDISFTTDQNAEHNLSMCVEDAFADPKGSVWGDSKKKNMSCNTYLKEFTDDPAVTGKINRAQQVTAAADTAAHELAHMLCATHNWNAPRTRKATDDTGKEARGNGNPVDLMTNGGKVSIAERGAGRSLGEAAKTQIRSGIKMLKAGKSWDLKLPDARFSVCLVPGRPDTMHYENEKDPTDVLRGPSDVDILAALFDSGSGLAQQFDMGFVSDENDFVPIITDDLYDPSGLTGFFMFAAGEAPTFAVGGEEGTAYEGLFFEALPITESNFSDEISGAFADIPIDVYWRTVQLGFDVNGDQAADLFMELNTSDLASTNGFKIVPTPATAVLLGIGLGASAHRRRHLG